MKKVCVVTGTRAEYGLLYWTIKAIQQHPELELQLCVTGMHLSPEFGLTYQQIEADGFKIDAKVEMLLSSDSTVAVSKSMGLAMIEFPVVFNQLKPDIILVLGDRFEIFAVTAAAMICRIPVGHCHGGEATEGLIDEAIRHSITKMSHLHFTSTEEFRNRVIQLGEQPDRVYNVGALGIENINRLTLLEREDFEKSIDFKLGRINFLVTFHPVTLDTSSAEQQFTELLNALSSFEDAHIIFTKPNADTDGRIIIKLIDDFVKNNSRATSFISMGQLRYLSAVKHVDAVIGNSSSGIVEVPSFQKPTVNIGDRQQGRIMAESVIQCEPSETSIKDAIELALSESYKLKLKEVANPYGTGNPSAQIVDKLATYPLTDILKKQFYNIN